MADIITRLQRLAHSLVVRTDSGGAPHTILEAVHEIERLQTERDEARRWCSSWAKMLLHEVAVAGVESWSRGYVVVQVPEVTWREIQAMNRIKTDEPEMEVRR